MTDTFTASNGITIRERDDTTPVLEWKADGLYCTDRGRWYAVGEGIDDADPGFTAGSPVAKALREFFQHERDEERGLWRSPSDPTWTAVRRNTTIYFQNEDHERSFHFVPKLEGSIRAWSSDLQALAYEYIGAHPERKPWHSAKPGEIWVLTIDDSEQVVSAVQQYEKDFNPISHPIYATFANGSERITAGRRIWPEDAS